MTAQQPGSLAEKWVPARIIFVRAVSRQDRLLCAGRWWRIDLWAQL